MVLKGISKFWRGRDTNSDKPHFDLTNFRNVLKAFEEPPKEKTMTQGIVLLVGPPSEENKLRAFRQLTELAHVVIECPTPNSDAHRVEYKILKHRNGTNVGKVSFDLNSLINEATGNAKNIGSN